MDEWIKDVIIDKAYSLRETLNSLKGKDLFSAAPREIIDALIEVSDEVIAYHDELSKLNAEDIDFIRLSLFLSQLHILMEEIKTVEMSDVPVELLPFLQQIMEKYDKDSMIYLRPTKEYNYAHISLLDFIYNTARKNLGYEKENHKRISRICFPLSEKNNVLLHCIFSHEIGHYFNEKFLILDGLIPTLKIDTKILMEIIEIKKKQMAETKKVVDGKPVTLALFVEIEEMRAEFAEKYTKVMANWLKELIADAIGASLLGPAFFFSLVELASSSSTYGDYWDSHPPLFLRIVVILSVLDNLGYSKNFEKFSKIHDKIKGLRSLSSSLLEKEESDLELRLLKSSIKPVLSKLIKETNIHISPIYDLTEVDKEITELIKLTKNLIPPNEIILRQERKSYPANPVAILNASWIVKLEYIEDLYNLLNANTVIDKYRTRVILNEHTLKALELTDIHSKLLEGIKRASS